MRAASRRRSVLVTFGLLTWMGTSALCTFLVSTGALASGDAPPTSQAVPLSDADRQKLLAARDRFDKESAQLQSQGKYSEAIATAEQMLAIERRVFGDVSDDVAESLGRIGRCHVAREDFAAARKALGEWLSIRSKLYGDHDWRVSDARRELRDIDVRAGLTLKERHQLVEADRVMSQAFDLYRKRDFPQAIQFAERVVNIRRRLLGNDHCDTATSLNNLALLYESRGDYAKAEPLHRQALEIYKKVLGDQHPDTAGSLSNLGALYVSMADYAKAEPLFQCPFAKRLRRSNRRDGTRARDCGTVSISAFAKGFHRGEAGEAQGRVGRAQNCH
jgi:tetratricopeptide (TPR) repeat protein